MSWRWAERAVLEQERSQLITLDRDVTQRLGHDRREKDSLSRQQHGRPGCHARTLSSTLRAGERRSDRIAACPMLFDHASDSRHGYLLRRRKTSRR
jgi:hypothetical protein